VFLPGMSGTHQWSKKGDVKIVRQTRILLAADERY
jgi:hypothetical protein